MTPDEWDPMIIALVLGFLVYVTILAGFWSVATG